MLTMMQPGWGRKVPNFHYTHATLLGRRPLRRSKQIQGESRKNQASKCGRHVSPNQR